MSSQRQLAAIMFTDIEGYTSLMQNDEKKAIALRSRHRDVFEKATHKHNGSIIQYFGDGTLSIFKSSVEAVNCAIEMQLAFQEDPKIPLRIGIHIGDILYSKEDIIGDAVNVASRIESCAIAGSILISDKVHDQIRSHRHIEAKFLDAYEFKNVEGALPLFAIANEGLKIPDSKAIKGKLKAKHEIEKEIEKRKHRNRTFGIGFLISILLLAFVFGFDLFKSPPPSDLSIAVLPLKNLSTDEGSDILTDGFTEDILTHLSKIKDLHVISRTSIMQYKSTSKTIPDIAKELNVAYVMEGSVQKYGDKIRVTAQLIDAKTDKHIWAENYDKTITDIFELQTVVSKEIVDALSISMSLDEQQNIEIAPTNSVEAYKLFLEGRREADKRNSESITKSIELYKKAIEIDPDYAEAYAEIANSIYLETYYSARDPIEAARLANEYLDKAEAITDKISRIHSVRGLILNIEGKLDEAKVAFEKAIAIAPNDLTAHHQFSTYYFYTRQYEKQLQEAEIAYRLDPLSFATANSYFNALTANRKYDQAEQLMKTVEKTNPDGNNNFAINRSYFRLYSDQKLYKKTIEPLKKIVVDNPVFNRFLAYSYVKVGDTVNAYKIIEDIRKRSPKDELSHQLAVSYSALKMTDSVLYHLDPIRNPQTRTLRREYKDFFGYLKDNPQFIEVLGTHGITPEY